MGASLKNNGESKSPALFLRLVTEIRYLNGSPVKISGDKFS